MAVGPQIKPKCTGNVYVLWGGQPEWIKNPLETGQPHRECRQYCAITTSTATASLDNKQDCKIPQSLGSGLGMRKTKNNLQTKWKSLLSFPFPYFSFSHAFPRAQCHTFPPPPLNHLGREKEEKISKDESTLKWNLVVFYDCKHKGSSENYFT